MDVEIIVYFKGHFQKLMIQNQIECLSANKVFAIDGYQVVIMVKRAWSVKVSTSTIQDCWRHI